MKNDNRISPMGLKGNEINERMKQLMGITQINENKSTSVVELTKLGPDGKVYGIVRENHEYYIKTANKTSDLVLEDFKYIGGLQNKKQEAYPSYAKAIKHLNLNFKSLAESYGKGGDINVFENDNLLKENAFGVGFSSNIGNGFSNEGNMEHNTPLLEKEEELSETEQDIDKMLDEEWKSDFDGNRDFDTYNDDKVDFEKKYGSIYNIVDDINADITLDDDIDNDIFEEFFDNELNKLKKFNLPKGQNLKDGERINFKSSPNGNTLSTDIYTLPNNKYCYWSTFKGGYLMGDDKEQIIKLAAIENKLFDISHSASIDKQTSRGESGWVDETDSHMSPRNKELAAMKPPYDRITKADKLKAIGAIQEHKLSIARALTNMDSIIDSLTEGEVKKKVYTLK